MSETVTQVNETTQQIVRSRTCGLKDFYIALVQSNTATASQERHGKLDVLEYHMRRYCDTDDVGAFGKEQPSDD